MGEHVAPFYPLDEGVNTSPLCILVGRLIPIRPGREWCLKKCIIFNEQRYVQSEGLSVARWVVVLTPISLSRHAGFCM